MSQQTVAYRNLFENQHVHVYLDGPVLTASCGGHRFVLSYTLENQVIRIGSPEAEMPKVVVLTAMEHLFGHFNDVGSIELHHDFKSVLIGSMEYFREGSRLVCYKHEFMQNPYLWHHRGRYSVRPESWVEGPHGSHPERPRVGDGELYRRYMPKIAKTISFQTLSPEKHLDVFYEWHHQDRVAKFWELDKTKDELKAYINSLREDPRTDPVLLSFDDVPAGYLEFYWVSEDRLAPYYDWCEAYDRGIHLLIGNEDCLGTENTMAVLESLTHFTFLDEARCRRLMGEPRADNKRMLRYVESLGYWQSHYEFDFPHKRAALLEATRQKFFSQETWT
ncbi:GNAT family N-acetyltransferase [Pseudobacteriovorax antillogorgiicola]|uniref:Acetyltransferase (GNAT) domain-containing protein n=1 Tax=Pseudobacteriovorax antillogorgiicola TaxID=1513793 RepID=A0A1Y6CPB6_9BACT|nr:GNAT family N-acetyltransferase [Pseudobacteriovorax antillogorgiicola]TCS43616.1 acetyltransferase (GNAT) family protein [Pseudobacteriovorax antillogorgiicola]SMF80046.1 Acetyltransferase (GNAT) domain-containing protein [Pseudobacteriovorax antillogorgiicola]